MTKKTEFPFLQVSMGVMRRFSIFKLPEKTRLAWHQPVFLRPNKTLVQFHEYDTFMLPVPLVQRRSVLTDNSIIEDMTERDFLQNLMCSHFLGSTLLAAIIFVLLSGNYLYLASKSNPSIEEDKPMEEHLDWQLPAKNHTYVDRDRPTEELCKLIHAQGTSVNFVVFCGVSGVGKSQFMANFAHVAESFSYKIWLTVNGPDMITLL